MTAPAPLRERRATGYGPASAQRRVLAARYRATLLGDWPTVVVLVAQAPFIGWLCTIVWGSVETDTPSLRFVLALAAVWFGCVNACREIVKERAIVERERLLGLSLVAYVASRIQVLAVLALAQVVLLQGAVEWKLALRGNFAVELFALWLAALAGTGIGLFVSALSTSQERAVGVVPLLLLPQILFSSFAIPESQFSDVVRAVEKGMPVHWAYEVFDALAAPEVGWGRVALALCALAGMTTVAALATTAALVRRRSVV
ncbi:MAG: ABC transporter permease [Pseudomonadota bacterium]|nr:ABC transporter permease [Pseudomonadota bacterium]